MVARRAREKCNFRSNYVTREWGTEIPRAEEVVTTGDEETQGTQELIAKGLKQNIFVKRQN